MLWGVAAIAPPPREPHLGADDIHEWEQTTLESVLNAAESKTLGYLDGEAVIDHCLIYRDIEYIQTR